MKILYLSCHSVLEYDEVKLFHELGHEVFSPGAYVCPENPGDPTMRPGVEGLVYDKEVLNRFHAIGGRHPGEDAKNYLERSFVNMFDVIIIMHIPDWVSRNWDVIKHKRVIWRTIGQSISSTEAQLAPYRDQGLEIVRYSPKEANIPGFIGQDALIRFYKDPKEFKGWNGSKQQVVTFAQSMKERNTACNFSFFEEVTRPFPRKLYGPGNEGTADFAEGKIPHQQQRQELQDSRVYFYTGTHPASYTLNFIEAWMTGIPMVCIGFGKGNGSYFHGHNLYEVNELIRNGETGFVSDSKMELQQYIAELLQDKKLAKKISKAGRAAAIHHFGKDMIKASWEAYLNG